MITGRHLLGHQCIDSRWKQSKQRKLWTFKPYFNYTPITLSWFVEPETTNRQGRCRVCLTTEGTLFLKAQTNLLRVFIQISVWLSRHTQAKIISFPVLTLILRFHFMCPTFKLINPTNIASSSSSQKLYIRITTVLVIHRIQHNTFIHLCYQSHTKCYASCLFSGFFEAVSEFAELELAVDDFDKFENKDLKQLMSSLNNFDKDRSSSGSFGLSKRLLSKSLAVPIRESPVNKKKEEKCSCNIHTLFFFSQHNKRHAPMVHLCTQTHMQVHACTHIHFFYIRF